MFSATSAMEATKSTRTSLRCTTNSSRRFPAKLSLSLLAAVLCVFIATGIAGRDFGEHWDEKRWQLDMTRDMVESRTLLSKEYVYPSLNLWINLAALLPEAVSGLSTGGRGASILKSILLVFDRHEYLLRLRSLYVILSSLALVWVFGLAWVWSRSPLEGALAAAMLGFSWELNYHSRWVAQDAVMTQFAALCLLLASVGRFRPQESGWLKASAVAAGLACGMKYTAGLLLIPLFVAAIQVRPRDSTFRSTLRTFAGLLLYFGLTYLATTPGTVLRPRQFVTGLDYNWQHYAQIGHGGNNVRPGMEHGARMLEYFGLVFFSPFPVIALALFGLCLLGVVGIVRRHRMASVVLLAFPTAYLLMFDRQMVMIVRNLLPLSPFLAVLAARGGATLWEWIRYGPARLVLIASLIAALGLNAGWLVYAVGTIQDRRTDRFLTEAVSYIAAHPHQRFFVSEYVRRRLIPFGFSRLVNVTATPQASEIVLISYKHAGYKSLFYWKANDRTQFLTWFGPYEVNMNYYPAWFGDDRIVAMTTAHAQANGIPAVQAAGASAVPRATGNDTQVRGQAEYDAARGR